MTEFIVISIIGLAMVVVAVGVCVIVVRGDGMPDIEDEVWNEIQNPHNTKKGKGVV